MKLFEFDVTDDRRVIGAVADGDSLVMLLHSWEIVPEPVAPVLSMDEPVAKFVFSGNGVIPYGVRPSPLISPAAEGKFAGIAGDQIVSGSTVGLLGIAAGRFTSELKIEAL